MNHLQIKSEFIKRIILAILTTILSSGMFIILLNYIFEFSISEDISSIYTIKISILSIININNIVIIFLLLLYNSNILITIFSSMNLILTCIFWGLLYQNAFRYDFNSQYVILIFLFLSIIPYILNIIFININIPKGENKNE